MKPINIILSLVGCTIMVGCSSTPIVLEPVGPAPANAAVPSHEGFLQVYTATEPHPDGDDTYYPHSSYHILTEAGKLWKYVPNHTGTMDESPAVVRIPAGNYKVVARTDGYGRVTVPVVVKGDKLTEVKLETWGRKKTPLTNEAAVVQLPNGYVVGWRAVVPKKSD
jgi:hypothetical protein